MLLINFIISPPSEVSSERDRHPALRLRARTFQARYGETSPQLVACNLRDQRRRADRRLAAYFYHRSEARVPPVTTCGCR
jgi:hypothetical protein